MLCLASFVGQDSSQKLIIPQFRYDFMCKDLNLHQIQSEKLPKYTINLLLFTKFWILYHSNLYVGVLLWPKWAHSGLARIATKSSRAWAWARSRSARSWDWIVPALLPSSGVPMNNFPFGQREITDQSLKLRKSELCDNSFFYEMGLV